jgi:hypothetical protein
MEKKLALVKFAKSKARLLSPLNWAGFIFL